MTSDPDLSPDERDADISATPNPPAAPSPGAQLRLAREQARLSLDDFARQTRLPPNVLEALEADDFESLLEPVYVRGYYRKCARLLGLPENVLIDAYNARVKQTQPQTPARIRLSAGATEGGRGVFGRLLGLLIMVIIVGLLAYLWFSRSDADDLVGETAVQIVPSVAITTTPAVTAMAAAQAEPEVEAEVEPVVIEATSAPVAASGASALHLQFRETSWVRINDADGRALMDGLIEGGSRETVSGKLPLSLFFGNAPGVHLEFNGQQVDLSPYTQSNNTARLSLPLAN